MDIHICIPNVVTYFLNFYKVKKCDLAIETRENIVAYATYVPEVNDGPN